MTRMRDKSLNVNVLDSNVIRARGQNVFSVRQNVYIEFVKYI